MNKKRTVKILFSMSAVASLLNWCLTPAYAAIGDAPLASEGKKAFDAKKYDQAFDIFDRMVKNSPKDSRNLYNRGAARYKMGDYEGASKDFESAIEMGPKRFEYYYDLGNSYVFQDRLNEAVWAYKEALKIKPNDKDAKYNLDYVLKLLDEKKKQKEQDDKNQKNKEENKNQGNQGGQDQRNRDQNNQQGRNRNQEGNGSGLEPPKIDEQYGDRIDPDTAQKMLEENQQRQYGMDKSFPNQVPYGNPRGFPGLSPFSDESPRMFPNQDSSDY